MGLTVIYSVLIVALFSLEVQSSPTIISQASLQPRSVGDTVYMLCQIKDLTNEVVIWEFLNHKIISKDQTLMVDEVNRFKIDVLQGDTNDSPVSYMLTISNLQVTDQGFYKCYIKDTNVSLTYELKVNEAPKVTPPVVHNYNFTDCCVKENVSALCRPVCDPFQTNLPQDFDPLTHCASDLQKLLKCGSDGKNHAPCCKRRMLPDICIDFCTGQIPPTLDHSHLQCLNLTFDIIECYEEGQDVLPGPPTSLSMIAATDGFVVKWQPPVDNSNLVVGYYIHYRLSADTLFKTSTKIDPTKSTFTISGLLPNKMYSVFMSSISHYGSSQPSEILTQSTIGGPPPTEDNLDIAGCCAKSKIPQKCSENLCKSSLFEDMDPSIVLSCYGYLDEALQCVTGKRDHTACCQRNSIDPDCLGFCTGEVPPLDATLSKCMIKLPLIEACVQEGISTIPGPPQEVSLSTVTQSTATIHWKPPKSQANATEYLVMYMEHGRDGEKPPQQVTVTETSVNLTDLTPNTEYDVRIISMNDAGQSLEAPVIGFTTYDIPSVIPVTTPSPGPPIPYNLSACCMQNNIRSDCIMLCDYEFIINADMTDLYSLAFACLDYFGTVIKCGADGRDHTDCCARRLIPSNCHPICKGDYSGADAMCAFNTPDITQCFREGVVTLPRPPSNVYIQDTTTHSIKLTWSPPDGGPASDHYKVHYDYVYQGRNMMKYVKVNKPPYIIQNLESGYTYTVSVSAGNDQGYSIPSPSIRTYVPPDDHSFNCSDTFTKYMSMSPDPQTVLITRRYADQTVEQCKQTCLNTFPGEQCTGFLYTDSMKACVVFYGKYGHMLPKIQMDFYARDCDFEKIIAQKPNITGPISWSSQEECCTNHNISDQCLPYCQTGNAFSNPQQCEDEFSTVVTCASDGKNHSSCCKAAGVPTSCLPYCWGAKMDPNNPVSQLCLSYTRMFVTCFTEGARTLPSIPKEFKVNEVGSTYVILSWAKSENNCNDSTSCSYTIQWTPGVNIKSNLKETKLNLTDLSPDKLYYVSVSASNMYGSSLPSPWIGIRTKSIDSFAVNFLQKPLKVIELGESVALICEVFGAPNAEVSITFKTKELTKDKVLQIDNVSDKDYGEYTCTVKKTPSDTEPVVKTINLGVRYKPDIKSVHGDQVQPNAAKTAYLKCEFYGLPMSVTWSKDGQTSVPYWYQTLHRTVFEADGTLSDTLEIHNVREEMFGRYNCLGKNKYGEALGHVELKNDYIPSTPYPTSTPPTTIDNNITDCCMRGNVQGVCLDLCHFNVDFAVILDNKYDSCVQLLPVYASCAADGKDHAKCCDDRGVTDFCRPFCKGSNPDLSQTEKLIECVADSVDILECIQSGRVNIPYAPQNVMARQQQDKIHVSWDPPKSRIDLVEHYNIFYQKSGGEPQEITIGKTILSYDIKVDSKFISDEVYTVWLTAGNGNGNSLESTKHIVTVTGFLPYPPKNLRTVKIDGNSIFLQWEPPNYTLNIAKYIVKYKISAENSIPKELFTDDSSVNKATLTGLELSTYYDIYVVGQSINGQEGQKSNTIHVTTGNTVSVSDQTKGSRNDRSSNKGVIAVVIIIVILLLGATVAGVIIYRRRNRHRFSEAVTFENPQYGSAHDSSIKISGLTADASEDNPFGYSPLQEETHYESPMLNVDQVEFKPRK